MRVFTQYLAFPTLIICTLLNVHCKLACEQKYSIDIYTGYFHAGEAININIDEQEYRYSKKYKTDYLRYPELLTTYCTDHDTVSIRFSINQRDTIIYIDPGINNEIYLGSDINGGFDVDTHGDWKIWF